MKFMNEWEMKLLFITMTLSFRVLNSSFFYVCDIKLIEYIIRRKRNVNGEVLNAHLSNKIINCLKLWAPRGGSPIDVFSMWSLMNGRGQQTIEKALWITCTWVISNSLETQSHPIKFLRLIRRSKNYFIKLTLHLNMYINYFK